ncbi:MAG: glucuronate isomerase [Lachnospiraceae bacterium]|nr:glucuronate isomerase [Lachnospiraceae bacterium]
MKKFMDSKDFLLSNETSLRLYEAAAKMPIIDYHCHINPREIAEDRQFNNITEVWLGGDHYKWRQMRSNGIDEKYITGDASDYEKFEKWTETLQKAIGNPLYHWSHLELQRYFGFNKPLSPATCKEAWDFCNKKLNTPEMSVRNIIKMSNVDTICTTDDPADTLEWHKLIKEDKTFDVKVLPAWRPDKAMNLEKPDYKDYLAKLEKASGMKIGSFKELCAALKNRMAFFAENGCLVSDHGLEYVMYQPASESEIESIFSARMSGKMPTREEEIKFKTAFMLFVGREYARLGWVMQLHYGALRDNNKNMYAKLGPDTGYDSINTGASAAELVGFLNALALTDELPKTILYSLNPCDNAAIGTIMGCFQNSDAVGKIQHGSAWWFNDNKTGMQEQMTSLANLGLLSNFVGMLTDSRSFLSYTRHEYFRRILCDLVGTWVENGEYPADFVFLEKMVQDISYNNCKRYFGF